MFNQRYMLSVSYYRYIRSLYYVTSNTNNFSENIMIAFAPLGIPCISYPGGHRRDLTLSDLIAIRDYSAATKVRDTSLNIIIKSRIASYFIKVFNYGIQLPISVLSH